MLPVITDLNQMAKTLRREKTKLLYQCRYRAGGECATGEAKQDDLVTAMVIAADEVVRLADVRRETFSSRAGDICADVSSIPAAATRANTILVE